MTDKKKILIIDDEPDLVKALKVRFQNEGYNVISAKDGAEGLEKARKENPDLIILDLMLPKIDGFRVCRFIKFDESYKHIPIIMLTARIEEEDKKLGFETGADYYMTKPFDNQKLMDVIKKFIG
ncbi:two-component system response regulator [candidate division KSB1 bacterium]|nr:MAG: two-component system response regulator [candidate division KSB1 bacterium]